MAGLLPARLLVWPVHPIADPVLEPALQSAPRVPALLGSCFEDHVERRLSGTSDSAEPACSNDLAKLGLAGLRAQCGTDFLRQRGRHASHRRAGVKDTADRVQIVFEF